VAGIGQELSLQLQCLMLYNLRLPDSVEHVIQSASETPDLVVDR